MALCFQLFFEGVEGTLLIRIEVAKSARRGLVVGICDARGHWADAGSFLGIGHDSSGEEEGG